MDLLELDTGYNNNFEGSLFGDSFDAPELALFEDEDMFFGKLKKIKPKKIFKKVGKTVKKAVKKPARLVASGMTAAPRAIAATAGGKLKDFKVFTPNKSVQDSVKQGLLGKSVVAAATVGAKKAGKAVSPFLAVSPFKSDMTKILKAKGVFVKTGSSLPAVSNLFYNNVIKKEGTMQEHFDYDLHTMAGDHADVAANTIVSSILSYFTAAKAKKALGADLSKDEELAAKGVDAAIKKATKKDKKLPAKIPIDISKVNIKNPNIGNDTGFNAGEFLKDNMLLIGGGLAALLVIMLISK